LPTRNLPLAFLLTLLVALSSVKPAVAQQIQVISSVDLAYMAVQLSYPTEILPAQTVTVTLQVEGKRFVRLLNLTAQIYYPSGNTLALLTTSVIAENMFADKSTKITKEIVLTVPRDAPRTSLIIKLSESVRIAYGFSCYDNSCYWLPPYRDYSYYPSVLMWYPPYTYVDATDVAIAPLSYIKAATPEYVSLQSELQILQEKLNQAQAENQKLKENMESIQESMSQKDATIAGLNQRVLSAEDLNRILEILLAVLAGITIFLTAMLLRRQRKRPQTSKTESKIDR